MDGILSFFLKLLTVVQLFQGVPAPVPRCSPFIVINKVVEWQSWSSDMNPFFPVPPCEYGGPLQALLAGDMNAVFLMDEPELIPRHNTYEFIWFLKTGYARLRRMLQKKEKFDFDFKILREGYDHSTQKIRTKQHGHGTPRRPEVLNDKTMFENVMGEKVKDWWLEGGDKKGANFNTEELLLTPPVKPIHKKHGHQQQQLHQQQLQYQTGFR